MRNPLTFLAIAWRAMESDAAFYGSSWIESIPWKRMGLIWSCSDPKRIDNFGVYSVREVRRGGHGVPFYTPLGDVETGVYLTVAGLRDLVWQPYMEYWMVKTEDWHYMPVSWFTDAPKGQKGIK